MAKHARNLKAPSSFSLPGGYDITVTRLSLKEADAEMGEGVYAQWDVGAREIHLRKERKGQEHREDFIHECEHAIVDWKDFFLGKTELED